MVGRIPDADAPQPDWGAPAITRETLATAIEVLIAMLDAIDAAADPDAPDFRNRSDGQPGDPADHEPGGDEDAGAYAEWDTSDAAQRLDGLCRVRACGHEDDEAWGDEDDGTCAEDEPCARFQGMSEGPGCDVADSGEEDARGWDDPVQSCPSACATDGGRVRATMILATGPSLARPFLQLAASAPLWASAWQQRAGQGIQRS